MILLQQSYRNNFNVQIKEFKVHNKHLNLIQKYESKKVAFDELYGEDIFEQIYDIHLIKT